MYRHIVPEKKYCKARQTPAVHTVCKRNYNINRNNKRIEEYANIISSKAKAKIA